MVKKVRKNWPLRHTRYIMLNNDQKHNKKVAKKQKEEKDTFGKN